MAEQPIKGTDIIESGMFNEAVKQADNFIAKLSELENGIKSNLQSSKEYLTTWKAQGSETLNTQAKATAEVTKELTKLEQLEQQRIRTQEAKIKLVNAIDSQALKQIKNEEQLAKIISNQTKEVKLSVSAYDALRKKYNDLVKAQIELSIRGRENGAVFKAVKQEVDAMRLTLDKAEQGAGRFQRNVGNYKSGFDSLGNSVNQLTSEFPAFAVSANTGFLAISNNLPIFFYELTKINKANAELIKQGKPIQSAFSQIGSVLTSTTSILSIGVTLLTLFGGKIIETVSSLFKQKDSLLENIDALKAYNEAIKESKKFQEELQKQIDNTTLSNLEQSKTLSSQEASALKALEKTIDSEGKAFEMRNNQIGKYITELLINGDKEAVIKQTITDNIIKIENEKSGEIVRLNKETGEVVGQYSAFYNKTLYSNTEAFAKSRIDQIRKEYRITQNLIKNNYDEEIKQTIIGEDVKSKKKIEKLVDLSDRIKKLQLEQIKDDKFREEQIALFESEQAKREVERIYATAEQKIKLKQAIDEDTQRKLLVISDKYQKIEDDKQKEATNKIIENEKKTSDAIFEIKKDNADFEIYQLEEKYKEEEAKGANANKEELKRLQSLINERKAILIQSNADEAKLKTENEAEQTKIQNEADIEIAKLKDANLKSIEDKDKKAKQDELKRQNDFNQKLIDAFAKAEAEKSKLKQDALQRDIDATDKNIERQRELANKGKANTLAFEEKEKARKQVELEKEKEQEIKRQKAIAIFKAFTSYMEQGDDTITAIAKAVGSVAIVDSIAGAFFTGTEKVADDLQDKKLHNGRDGYRIAVDGSERIMTGEQNKLVGDLSNAELANLANDYNNGLLDTAKYAVIQKDFATNVKESYMLMQMANLNKQVESLTNTIKNRPISNFEFDGYGNFIKETIENGFNKRTIYKQEKPRI